MIIHNVRIHNIRAGNGEFIRDSVNHFGEATVMGFLCLELQMFGLIMFLCPIVKMDLQMLLKLLLLLPSPIAISLIIMI